MDHECEICEQQAARLCHDLNDVSLETIDQLDEEGHGPPWYFCDEHGGDAGLPIVARPR